MRSNCDQWQEALSCCLDGESPKDEIAPALNHLASCDNCAQFIKNTVANSAALSQWSVETPTLLPLPTPKPSRFPKRQFAPVLAIAAALLLFFLWKGPKPPQHIKSYNLEKNHTVFILSKDFSSMKPKKL